MTVTRTIVAEGQILRAAQLTEMAEVPRARSERHNRLVHRWGIVSGLSLKAEETEDGNGNVFSRVFVEIGMAIDGHGREILVTERIELNARRFRLRVGNSVAEETPYPVFLISQFRPVTGAAGASDPCAVNGPAGAVEEGVEIVFGQPGDETDEEVAPDLSSAPSPSEGSTEWPVLVGFVTWTAAAENFAGVDAEYARGKLPFVGVTAATVAGDDLQVQLQPKSALAAGDAVFQVQQTDDGPALCFGTFKGVGRPIEALFKVDGKGDLTAEGSITGKRTGNNVQVDSGIASHGMRIPLPPGVTQAQVDDEEATVHIHVAPLTDPAYAPDPNSSFAALVEECRVDDDRRVHCRIAWAELDFAAPAIGGTLSGGPGAVRYLIAVATSSEEGEGG